MKPNIYRRRMHLLDLYHRNQLNQTNVEELAAEENVSPKTIWSDWNRHPRWLCEIAQIDQSRTLVLGILCELKAARASVWRICDEARKARQFSAAVGAIGKILESISKEINLRQSLGFMDEKPQKLEIILEPDVQSAIDVLMKSIEKQANPELTAKMLRTFSELQEEYKNC